MKAPLFWKNPKSLRAHLLSPLGALYGFITTKRMQKKGVKLPVPVICIGNATLGGAGKTPTAIAIAKMLIAQNKSVCFLSRGYKAKLKAPTLVQPHHTALEVGDEPKLLSEIAPTIIAKNRLEGAKLALQQIPDYIILDDGFQNPELYKDMSILVIDTDIGLGNGYCFPAGNLRAPLKNHLKLATHILLIGENEFHITHKNILKGTIEIKSPFEKGTKVTAFCGLAEPQKFKNSLEKAGLNIKNFESFPDHYAYKEEDLKRLKLNAGNTKLITTRKDAVKLTEKIATLDIELKLETQSENQLLDSLLHHNRETKHN